MIFKEYSCPPLATVLISVVSVIWGQLWLENIKLQIPEMNNS